MKYKPTGDYVLLQMSQTTKSAGGIELPESAREFAGLPQVAAVGPGRRTEAGERVPVDLKVGEQVLTDPNINPKGRVIESNGEVAYFLFREHEIIATADPGVSLALA